MNLAQISTLNTFYLSDSYKKKLEAFLAISYPNSLEDLKAVLSNFIDTNSLSQKSMGFLNEGVAHKQRQEHENYFQIKRVKIKNVDLVFDNLLRSFYEMICDCLAQGHTLPLSYFENIFLTIRNVMDSKEGSHRPLFSKDSFISIKQKKSIQDPLKRWMLGHYLFFSIIQVLILVHNSILLKKKDSSPWQGSLWKAGNLFFVSIAAFQYGTNYSSLNYQENVRPSMGLAHFPSGFSDLNSIDHRALLSCIKKVRTSKIFDTSAKSHIYYRNAISSVYDNHSHVCAKAVGKSTSLLQNAGDTESSASLTAPELIRKVYKKRTLKLAGVN